ncbi:DUF4012 domain-containing protein [Candidatus Roizmanbacteria bacterium]|nr:DUF4012 domain-containing protein [Candidatus Roizmanbacteria bacterium]
MRFETEIVHEKQKALIISKMNYAFITVLKTHLKKFSVDHFFSSILPKSLDIFDYLIIIDSHITIQKIKENPEKKFIFIFSRNKAPSSLLSSQLKNIKIVTINSENLNAQDIDKILWFAFSPTKEILLKINWLQKTERDQSVKRKFTISRYFTKKNSIIFIVSIFVLLHLLFVPFLIFSSYFVYQGYQDLKKEDFSKAENSIKSGSYFYQISKKLYSFSRPTYRLLGVSLFPDNLMEINNNGIEAIEETTKILVNSKEIQRLVFAKNKGALEEDDLKLRLSKLDDSLEKITENLIIINQKLDFQYEFFKPVKNKLSEASDLLNKSKKLLLYFETALTKTNSSKYLLFFANNMELRPGGGFLGSFAIINIANYEIGEIKIYDVYDADGQLTAHIDPPKPISQYLNIPHWFLRDSNFSPDFFENYEKALFFLEKELGMTGFDGSVLLTTSAVENILSSFDNIFLPDFKENINSKNFYLKTQFYAEKNFFPGSIQKQVFLSSVVQQIILNLDNISLSRFLTSLKKSLDEKQVVVYLKDETAQALFDSSFWSGRVIEPKCLAGPNDCLIDYLFPYDANVGANKANFFINRSLYFKTNIDSQGKINHLLSIQYQNTSPSEIFPTGVYRNYFQILIPRDSTIKQITKEGILVEDFDQKDDKFKLVGFYFEVPPKKTVEIKISYQLENPIKKGRQIYQLVVQKQIGASNSDLIVDFRLNKNISLVNQNFSPLVKDDKILYNTNLSTDKIFFMELSNDQI